MVLIAAVFYTSGNNTSTQQEVSHSVFFFFSSFIYLVQSESQQLDLNYLLSMCSLKI